MNALRTVFAEVAGLFVEDRYYASAIALWLAFALGAPVVRLMPPAAGGAVLFGGLAVILIVSIARAARSSRS